VNATASENMVTVADAVKGYISEKNATLPAGLALKSVVDMTHYLNARLDMMLKNLLQGAVLVALLLTLFLRFKLALWVLIGLPVCFLGAVMLMPVIGVSINIVSLFAFIMVLGIVVDDAIVIGESVYTEVEHKGGGVNNVVAGAQRVATPATFWRAHHHCRFLHLLSCRAALNAPFSLASRQSSSCVSSLAW
jgi:Cation/multidrug efflux pump